MEKRVLINEIVNFCLNYKIFKNTVNIEQIKNNIETQLDDVTFVENLIKAIHEVLQNRKIKYDKKVKDILLNLEELRLDYEYK